MQQYFSRFEAALVVGALGLLVVGVSLLAVPSESPPATHGNGVFAARSPSPAASPAASPSPPPGPVVAAAPATQNSQSLPAISASGPSHLVRWQTGKYRVAFEGTGTRQVAIWWTGSPMADWTWQLVDGHCDLSPSRDRLSGAVFGSAVIELDLTPGGKAAAGQLVMEGSESGGPALGLAVIRIN